MDHKCLGQISGKGGLGGREGERGRGREGEGGRGREREGEGGRDLTCPEIG